MNRILNKLYKCGMTFPNSPTYFYFHYEKCKKLWHVCPNNTATCVGEGHTLNKRFQHSTTPNASTAVAVATATWHSNIPVKSCTTPTLTNTSAIMTLSDKSIRRLQENTTIKLDKTMHPHEIKRHTWA